MEKLPLHDAFCTRLGRPGGRIAAAAVVHTFGDYLVFHPHLHVFAAGGLFDEEGRFHAMPEKCPPLPAARKATSASPNIFCARNSPRRLSAF